MEERIDIYDDDRRATGVTVARGTRMEPGQYQLYVTAIVQDLEGRYLITQRALDKSWGAGWWEVTGGGALAGETSAQAVVREVAEEVGLDASHTTPQLLYSYKNVDPERGDNYFMDVYRLVLDFDIDDVTLQASEAIAGHLATWDEIGSLNEQGVFLHYARIATALGKI